MNAIGAAASGNTPPRWKLWLLRWAGLYPTLLFAYLAIGPLIASWPLPWRLLLISGIGTFSLSYVVMPILTRQFSGWLNTTSKTQ
jgi:uncharacterized protein